MPMTVYDDSENLLALTQTRCMTLVGENSKRAAMRLLGDMDNRTDKVINQSIQTTLRSKDGQKLILQFRMQPIHNKEGEVKEYTGLLRDISDQKAIEQQMARETAKVQEVENTKNSFIRNMVQEIRTPMNSVMEYVSQIGEKNPTDDEAQICKGIEENADYLLHLINNILYLSRLEARMVEIDNQPHNFADRFFKPGDYSAYYFLDGDTLSSSTIKPEEVDFAKTFDDICLTLQQRIQEPGVEFWRDNPYDSFVTNAVKFTKKGHIRVGYRYDDNELYLFCEDTGAGIPAEKQKIVFDRFVKLDEFVQGTGMGLAICKSIAESCGGKIGVKSDGAGRGSTFWVRIPCNRSFVVKS